MVVIPPMARKGFSFGRSSLHGVTILAVAAGLVAATCGRPRPTRLEGEGVRAWKARRVEPARAPGGATVAPGDFVLQGGGTRVVIGGLQRGGEGPGAVLEALAPGASVDDGVVLLGPRVYHGQRHVPVRVEDMYIVERAGRPAVRLEGVAHVQRRAVAVVQEVTLGGGGAWLSFTSRVRAPDGEGLAGVRLGRRLAWGGAPPFVPGVGSLDDPAWHEAHWLGRGGDAVSVALGFHEGPLRVRGVYEQHGDARFLSHTEMTSPRLDPTADGDGDTARLRSNLAVVAGSLAEPVRRLGWARGDPFAEVLVTLPYAPEGARVVARTEDGKPVVGASADARGQVLLPLPPIRGPRAAPTHVLVASAYGHAPSDPVSVRATDRRARVPIPRGGRVRVTVADAEGEPMIGRVRLVGIEGTSTPDLGPVWRASGAGDTVIAAEGDIVLPVPPGQYRAIVSHGPEWSLQDETVEVTETFQPRVRGRLEHLIDPGDWVACDFHLHAAPSYDSEVDLEDRLTSLSAEGIAFAVPTDHNHVTDYASAASSLRLSGFGTVPGVEVSTWDPMFGHFNAYPYPVRPDDRGNGAPAYQRTSPAELFSALREAGEDVVVQVNHPRLEPDIGYFDSMGLDPTTGSASDAYSDDFDVIEVWNGFDIARPERVEQVLQDWLALLARGDRVVANGSSDSHQIPFQWAGYPRTYVRVPGGAPEDGRAVVRSLLAGRAFVTNGPFLEAWVGDGGLGDVASPAGDVLPVKVRVRAAPWMTVDAIDLFVGDERVRTVPVETSVEPAGGARRDVVRFDDTVELPAPDHDTFVVVRVRGEDTLDAFFGREEVRPMAFTNPIWIDADGDGAVPWVEP
ncbi:MAG: CehA/McbA family metallohydrolase [Myxococcota bacterium]